MCHENSGASKVVKNRVPTSHQNFRICQIHSFPIMYNTMGSKVDGLTVRDHFLPKNGLKQLYWGSQFWINWLQRGLGHKFLKVSLTSACVLKKLEHYLQNELWARRQASIVSEKQVATFLEGGSRKVTKKTDFFH